MKTPRDTFGADLTGHLVRHWESAIVHPTGSHIVLRTPAPSGPTISIPAHKTRKIGTFNAIVRSDAEHKSVSRQDVLRGL